MPAGSGDSCCVPADVLLVGRSLLTSPGFAEVVAKPKLAAPIIPTERVDQTTLEARARKGDPDALDRIVRAELPRVERLLLRILGPRHDLEDLVQTVFLETCRALPGFRGESQLSTFVGGITVRVARRAMRSSPWWRRRGPMPEEEPASPSPSPDSRAMAKEQLRRTRLALEKINPKKRIAFLLWALEGLSFEEIAALTESSVPATRSRIFYAQKELKKKAEHDPYLRDLIGDDDDGR
jgi:RNA polymerase sigma-70 factor, ECF subfamily